MSSRTPSSGRSHVVVFPNTRPGYPFAAPLCIGFRPVPFALLALGMAIAGILPNAEAATLPQGGAFVAGAGQIGSSVSGLNISQSTSRGIIDWKSFSIGAGQAVSISNGAGATLNRVTGGSLSSIEGQLKATGSVYLINPQGIVIGSHGTVSTGGRFVASTLDTSNSAFMGGGNLTLTGLGSGCVVNLGTVSSSGGDVFLISRKFVGNMGSIQAAKGTAELNVGSNILLQDSSTGQQVFVDAGTKGTVVNAGAIHAAQISLQAADGNIYALAAKNSALRAIGTATRDGQLWLVADTGAVHAQGVLAARDLNGSGGTVTTHAKTLDVGAATVTAAQWTLDTPGLTITSTIASGLTRSLGSGTSVNVNATGSTAGTGNIAVDASINWTGNASLTLGAMNNVTVASGATLSNSGSGNLTLRADANSADTGGGVVNHGVIDWSHSTGRVNALYDMSGSYTRGTVKSNASWRAPAYSGLVTQFTAYQLVNSFDDLENISSDLTGNYALGKDISLSGSIFSPIGDATSTAFSGQFDGMGHTIDGTRFIPESASSPYEGMFYAIGSTGVVRNVNLTNANINLFLSDFGGGIGLLAGLNAGLITHVTTAGSIYATTFGSGGAGGIVAINNGTIEQSSSTAYISAYNYDGGLVGTNNGLILQSFSNGTVAGDTHALSGGIAGINTGTITQSYAEGSLGAYAGGGLVYANTGKISESYVTGSFFDQGYGGAAGGIAQTNTGTIASNVFWNTDVTGVTDSLGSFQDSPAVGLSAARMSQAASFGPTWDFSATGAWAMPAGASAPVLRWQLTE